MNENPAIHEPQEHKTQETIETAAEILRRHVSSVEEILNEAKSGRKFIIINEASKRELGNLCIPAQFVTAEVISAMARGAGSMIRLAMTGGRARQLGLPLIKKIDEPDLEIFSTVSIEARNGIVAGFSAAELARTVAVAINSELGPEDIVTPGHVCPLIAHEGGTLVHADHTEAAVDISRLAGLIPASVLCAIMNEDGTRATLSDIITFAQDHYLKLGTITELVGYRRRTEYLVKRVEAGVVSDSAGTNWRVIVYRSDPDGVEHLVLSRATLNPDTPVFVRIHRVTLPHDILYHTNSTDLKDAMEQIGNMGHGIIIVIREARRIENYKQRYLPSNDPTTAVPLNDGLPGQILADLGIGDGAIFLNST